MTNPPTTTPVASGNSTAAPTTTPVASGNSTAAQTLATSATATTGKGTNPLVIKGYRFFDSVTGEYVGMRGVNYYPRTNTGALDANNLDLFSDKFKHIWERDLPQFAALNANSIRLYAVDADANHDEFMCALQSLGIYVLVDLGSSCQGCEITADKAPTCYPASYKQRGEKIIKAFSKYDNVLGFSGGNEINHRTGGNPPQWNAPCQKKFVRDMRAFIKSCPSMRQIPVGLVMADTSRPENAKYYNCRTDPNDKLENAEWYGINVYVHCDDINDPTKAAGFNLLRDDFESYDYSIPVILTEFGCTAPSFPTLDGYEAQRTFHDAKWMNTKEYSHVFNGGFAFEYSTENANSKSTSEFPFKKFGPQNYGLGYLTPEDCDDVDVKCSFKRFPNFDSLADAYKATDNSGEPTLSTFTVEANRKDPTACPAQFPKLKDLTWAGDSQDSIACPTEGRFQCPNVPLNLQITAVESAEAEGSASSGAGTKKEEAGSDSEKSENSQDDSEGEEPPAEEDGEATEETGSNGNASAKPSAQKDKSGASGYGSQSDLRPGNAPAPSSSSTLGGSTVATAVCLSALFVALM
ncbi:hypothetical protein Poli38472_005048 [Pythium oligandrum]|uniref:Glycoside hydrolase n=1 Tax=Pythium oligandrum TaxID=41045 RepID=A0A8K1FG67_PYTOL|nr:hypothetical protein Poli38472_005048 [Pythium oligandrum]|eukprot:TMW62430.1 hypothetical protein Poli38472_005048 [Pythium oligandrum]